ncbi:hypothetical protein GJ496_001701 [Pomphorhynchus laevis]|nr:hypothetical protein GJ496_001701 [Pomphorhynchus laevis]
MTSQGRHFELFHQVYSRQLDHRFLCLILVFLLCNLDSQQSSVYTKGNLSPQKMLIICKENSPLGTLVYNFASNIVRDQNIKWNFRLLSVVSVIRGKEAATNTAIQEQLNKLFMLRPNGKLLVNAIIDREELCPRYCECSQCIFKLEIVAESDNGEMNFVQQSIQIEDENDNLPAYNQTSYNIRLSEFHSTEVPIQLPCAIDPDSKRYSIQSIKLKSESRNKIPFALIHNSSTPNCPHLHLLRELDAEHEQFYQLKLCAFEHIDAKSARFACCTLDIDVIDENDNDPVFQNSIYRFTIMEEESSGQSGSLIGRVTAHDVDKIDEHKIRYRLVDNRYADIFQIDEKSGVVSIGGNISFDRELVDHYLFRVVATDSTGRTAYTQVLVQILDKNDNNPTFQITFSSGNVRVRDETSNESTVDIKENLKIGSQLMLIRMSDIDSGDNGRVELSLNVWYNSTTDLTNTSPFRLQLVPQTETNSSFLLTLTQQLDCEQISSYRIWLNAKDRASHAHRKTSRYTINVKIVDVNDNQPEFTMSNYQFSIYENSKIGSHVGQVTAIDRDQTAKPVLYFLQFSGKQNTYKDMLYFSIDNHTGIIQSRKMLDREQQDKYVLEVIASDQEGKYGSANITILVLDINDNPPKFEKNLYVLAIEENEHYSNALYQFHAVDRDQHSVLHYRISTNDRLVDIANETSVLQQKLIGDNRMTTNLSIVEDHFKINATSGELWLTKQIDREQIEKITFFIEAIDSNDTVKIASALVQINIIDKNDNAPEIMYPTDGDLVCSNEMQGDHSEAVFTYFLYVNASDVDRGINGETNLIYSGEISYQSGKQSDQTSEIRFNGHCMRIIVKKYPSDYIALPISLKVCDRGRPKSMCAAVRFTFLFTDHLLLKSDEPVADEVNDTILNDKIRLRCENAKNVYIELQRKNRIRHTHFPVILIALVVALLLTFIGIVLAYKYIRKLACRSRRPTLIYTSLLKKEKESKKLKSRKGVSLIKNTYYDDRRDSKCSNSDRDSICKAMLLNSKLCENQQQFTQNIPFSLTTDV